MKRAMLILVLMVTAAAWAQQPGHPPQPGGQPHPRMTPPPGGDEMMAQIHQNIFPPDFVMRNRQAIGLTNEQSEFIKGEVLKSQAKFTELQWSLMDEQETIAGLVKADHVDEAKVLAELDKVLDLEREIKRAQFGLVIRIKNKLTAEQQAKLRQIKQQGQMTPTPPPDNQQPPGTE